MRASSSCAMALLRGSGLICVPLWWFRKFAASLASKAQPERQETTTDAAIGVDHERGPMDDDTIAIDVEQYEPVSDIDTDMVI